MAFAVIGASKSSSRTDDGSGGGYSSNAKAPTSFMGYNIQRATQPFLDPVALTAISTFIPLKRLDKQPTERSWCSIGVCVGRKPGTLKLWDFDLQSKPISVALRGAAEQQHWSTDTGAVVLIRDAKVMSSGVLCAIQADSLRVMGHSTDLGMCEASRPDGAACGSPIHRGRSSFCLQHLAKAVQRMDKENRAGGITVPRTPKTPQGPMVHAPTAGGTSTSSVVLGNMRMGGAASAPLMHQAMSKSVPIPGLVKSLPAPAAKLGTRTGLVAVSSSPSPASLGKQPATAGVPPQPQPKNMGAGTVQQPVKRAREETGSAPQRAPPTVAAQKQPPQPQKQQQQQQQQQNSPSSSGFLDAFGASVEGVDDASTATVERRAVLEGIENRLHKLAAQEAAQHELGKVMEVDTIGFYCSTCHRWSFKLDTLCTSRGHDVRKEQTVKRFFRCANKECQCGATVLGSKMPPHACPRCNGQQWRQVGAHSQRESLQKDRGQHETVGIYGER
eukprot:PhM_4_TR12248/c0_g1_i1/m.48778